jgi:transcription elongation factor Elf1
MPHTDRCLTSVSLLDSRPRCPVCGEEMWLVRVLPIAPDKIKRTFQCPVCEPSPAEYVTARRLFQIRQ